MATFETRAQLLHVLDGLMAVESELEGCESFVYIYNDPACDGEFEEQSNAGELAVLASCDQLGHALLFFLRMVIDRNADMAMAALYEEDATWFAKPATDIVCAMIETIAPRARRFTLTEPLVSDNSSNNNNSYYFHKLSWFAQQMRSDEQVAICKLQGSHTDFWTLDTIRRHI